MNDLEIEIIEVEKKLYKHTFQLHDFVKKNLFLQSLIDELKPIRRELELNSSNIYKIAYRLLRNLPHNFQKNCIQKFLKLIDIIAGNGIKEQGLLADLNKYNKHIDKDKFRYLHAKHLELIKNLNKIKIETKKFKKILDEFAQISKDKRRLQRTSQEINKEINKTLMKVEPKIINLSSYIEQLLQRSGLKIEEAYAHEKKWFTKEKAS